MGELFDFQGIANYGIYWQRDKVNWWPGRRGGGVRLLGKKQRAARQHLDNATGAVDFSNQRGIYLLHQGQEVVYVGLTVKSGTSRGLFYRLRWHHSDPTKSPFWDRFSWFGFRLVKNGKLEDIDIDADQHVPMSALVHVVETVLIQACMPRLNGQTGQLRGDIYGQVRNLNLAQELGGTH